MNKEVRNIVSGVELRADVESRMVEGYAVRFNEWSRDLGGFTEIIRSTAITQELVDQSDVVMCINHDQDKMVARRKNGNGTLELELREEGLYFSFQAPDTELGKQLLYDIRNGNLDECSFAFSLDWEDESCERWVRDGKNLKREILKIAGLYDCSIVTHAAYPTTSCSARGEQMVAKKEEVDAALSAVEEEINQL